MHRSLQNLDIGAPANGTAAAPANGTAAAPANGAGRAAALALVTQQISVGGFGPDVSAESLSKFFTLEAGHVWRCRVKTSCTPPDFYPSFPPLDGELAPPASSLPKADLGEVAPHAFVHFVDPDAARRALDAAGRNELIFGDRVLRCSAGQESALRSGRRRSTNTIEFDPVSVDVGFLTAQHTLATKAALAKAKFVVDPFDGQCRIVLPSRKVAFSLKNTRDLNVAVIPCDLKLEFAARDILEIRQYRDFTGFSVLIRLACAPVVFYRTADDDIIEITPFELVDDDDPWIRTTDFTPGNAIGQCMFLRVGIPPKFRPKLDKAMAYLREQRVPVSSYNRLTVRQELNKNNDPVADNLFFSVQPVDNVSFTVLFMLSAVVHKGIFNQNQLTEELFVLLRNEQDDVNVAALRHIWSYKQPIFDACKRLRMVQDWLLKNTKILHQGGKITDDTAEVRRLVITPVTAYCIPPEVELSNRVIRHYKDVADRFLRVTFTDEGLQQLNNNVLNFSVAPIVREITGKPFQQKTSVFKRIKTILMEGFLLCGRRYLFLAFSANQLRDRSAWFFAEDGTTKIKTIIKWMGKFTNKNVAKCAARMGQCFSSTYATVKLAEHEVNEALLEVERHGYIFSDGIGKITPDLALEVAEKLNLMHDIPSAFQIRYAGYKGVIAVWKGSNDGKRLSLRPSMCKFESRHTILEVVSWTRIQPGFLNRQIITLLSSLGVPDAEFWNMQSLMISKLNKMIVDTDVAFDVLTSSCAEQGNVAAIMLSAGFKPEKEQHLKAMLSAVRSAQLGDLLGKARIFVPKGRWLMGCLDELAILEQGQCFVQISTPLLENCFAKHGSMFPRKENRKEVILGTVVIAKNPCLHPGDIRILEAVDDPSLHHLVDCLVFPQKGDRPHPNEASGSDLDGDLYFVTWDSNLIPPGKRSWLPMDYTPAKPLESTRQVEPKEIIEFFLKNMVNENLGVICNAHVVHSDLSEYGAMDEKCIQLAELAATAVDFPKTGKIVTMPPSLRPKLYPDFMGKEDHLSYKSEKILGKLYREIRDATVHTKTFEEEVCTLDDLSFDADLEVLGAENFTLDAWNHKCRYDRQLSALLTQYRVRSEGEIVTGHIWSLPRYNSRKHGEMKERLKNAYNSLSKEFRNIFDSLGEGSQQLSDDEKQKLYEQKASAWYQVTYHPKWLEKATEVADSDVKDRVPAHISFPWIAADYLARIKLQHQTTRKFDCRKPVDMFAKYLYDRR